MFVMKKVTIVLAGYADKLKKKEQIVHFFRKQYYKRRRYDENNLLLDERVGVISNRIKKKVMSRGNALAYLEKTPRSLPTRLHFLLSSEKRPRERRRKWWPSTEGRLVLLENTRVSLRSVFHFPCSARKCTNRARYLLSFFFCRE